MTLAVSLRSRGPMRTAARTATVLSRFGPTSSLMARRLERYAAIASELDARPTWPATACVLARHPELLRRHADRGVELAVHGLVHGDHSVLGRARQRDDIGRALEVFDRHGLRPTGFRGPYLRYNDATLDVLRELGFRYHSSQAVVFPLVGDEPSAEQRASFARALDFYTARDARQVAVVPRMLAGIVDIPVAVPDDEILLDRLRFDGERQTEQWLHMLARTHHRGELFTMQLHPERIEELGPALHATLGNARARRPSVFIARLDEIADWWQRRARFVLGVTRGGHQIYCVRLHADSSATLLVRGLTVPRLPWYGEDTVSLAHEFIVEGPRMPVVSLSRRTPPEVAHLLAEEGFPYEISDDGASYGAHVDVTEAWSEVDVLDAIDAGPGPLVRLWRWPNAARSALSVTGDIDALTLRDFVVRSWETRDYCQATPVQR